MRNADSMEEIKANNATDAGKSQYRNSQMQSEERPASKVGQDRSNVHLFFPCIKVIHLSKILRKHELMVHWMAKR